MCSDKTKRIHKVPDVSMMVLLSAAYQNETNVLCLNISALQIDFNRCFYYENKTRTF